MPEATITLSKTPPLYLQVRDSLVARIQNGEWRVDQAIPSEIDLARQYNVSIGTTRKTLECLECQGFVERRQGRGTFICEHPSWESMRDGIARNAVGLMVRCRPSNDPALALELIDEDGNPIMRPGAGGKPTTAGYTRGDIALYASEFSELLAWIDREALKPAQDDKTVTKIKVAA